MKMLDNSPPEVNNLPLRLEASLDILYKTVNVSKTQTSVLQWRSKTTPTVISLLPAVQIRTPIGTVDADGAKHTKALGGLQALSKSPMGKSVE